MFYKAIVFLPLFGAKQRVNVTHFLGLGFKQEKGVRISRSLGLGLG